MNQKITLKINLADVIGTTTPYGNKEGKTAFTKLSKVLDNNPESKIIEISLKGIDRMDSSFPRESFISLAKLHRGEKGFALKDFKTTDLFDNCDAGAKAKDQSILVFENSRFKVLGPKLSSSMLELLNYIVEEDTVTTSMVAEKFKVSSPNASGKLKKLHGLGLTMGTKEVAESGGLEFVYKSLKS